MAAPSRRSTRTSLNGGPQLKAELSPELAKVNAESNENESSPPPKRLCRQSSRLKARQVVDEKQSVLVTAGSVASTTTTVFDDGKSETQQKTVSPKAKKSNSPPKAPPSSDSSITPSPSAEKQSPATPVNEDVKETQMVAVDSLNKVEETMTPSGDNIKNAPPSIESLKALEAPTNQPPEPAENEAEAKMQVDPSNESAEVIEKSFPCSEDQLKAPPSLSSNSVETKMPESSSEPTSQPLEPASTEPKKKKSKRSVASSSSSTSARELGPVMVTTALHREEQAYVEQVVAKLGGFTVRNEVVAATTHLVCGFNRRTMNVYRAICRGCWILSLEWVSASEKNGHWLPEEEFETVSYFRTCRAARLLHQKADSNAAGVKMPVFAKVGSIYVIPNMTRPKSADLIELVELCGGRIARSIMAAKVVVALAYPTTDVPLSRETTVVTPKWLFSSIMATLAIPTRYHSLSGPQK